jgi:predicted DCC family thiol-disulfide oxidoreductase YuxK
MNSAEAIPTKTADPPVLLFDGVCNVCNAGVNFILDHERNLPAEDRLRFAALQSEYAKSIFAGVDQSKVDMSAAVLIENGQWYRGSTAILRAARYLRWPWRAAWIFIAVPPPVREWFYRRFAGNRYRWFGKSEMCRVPTEALKGRFLV